MGKITPLFDEISQYFYSDLEKFNLVVKNDSSSDFGFAISNKHLDILFSSEYYYDTIQVFFHRKDCDLKATLTGLNEVLNRKKTGKYPIEYPDGISSELARKLYFNLHKLFFFFFKRAIRGLFGMG